MTHNKEFFDVAIIGASLAGSAAAVELGKQGMRVALLDGASFPRRKSCGEGLSHLARPYLEYLGISAHDVHADKNEFFGYRFVAARYPSVTTRSLTIRSGQARGWGVPRSHIDMTLLRKAEDTPLVKTYLNEKVREIHRRDSSWEVLTNSRCIQSQFVIVATGANPRAICAEYVTCTHDSSDRLGLSFTGRMLAGELGEVVTILPFPSGELYITALGDHRVNVSAVGEYDFVQEYREPRTLYHTLHRTLGIEVEIEIDSRGAAHFSSRRQSLDPNLYLVGDALETFDPACGLGMTHALSTALLASKLIHSVIIGSLSPIIAQRRYETRHRGIATGIRRFSWFIRTCMSAYRASPRLFALLPTRLARVGLGSAQLLVRSLKFDPRALTRLMQAHDHKPCGVLFTSQE